MPTVIRDGVKPRHEGSIQHETNASPEPDKSQDDQQKSTGLREDQNSLNKPELGCDSCSVASGGSSLGIVPSSEHISAASSRDLVPISNKIALRNQDGAEEKEQRGKSLNYNSRIINSTWS